MLAEVRGRRGGYNRLNRKGWCKVRRDINSILEKKMQVNRQIDSCTRKINTHEKAMSDCSKLEARVQSMHPRFHHYYHKQIAEMLEKSMMADAALPQLYTERFLLRQRANVLKRYLIDDEIENIMSQVDRIDHLHRAETVNKRHGSMSTWTRNMNRESCLRA
jgi:hypothetical protein